MAQYLDIYRMPLICESALVDLLKAKNEKAFTYLYDHYAPAILGVIIRRVKCPSTAEEILQNVFLKIWVHIELYSPDKSSLYTWMHTVARNETIDHLRSKEAKNKRHTTLVGESEISGPFIEQTSIRRDIQKSLSRLGHSERIIVELFFIGFTCKEIAALNRMPEGSVKTKMRYAYKKLKVMLS
jgi:RNA polymerase sigma factor (sigma-70 family)